MQLRFAVEIFDSHVNGYLATTEDSDWKLESTLVREAFDDLEICFDEHYFLVKKVKLHPVSEEEYIKLFLWKKITDTSLYQWYQTEINRLNYLRRFLKLSKEVLFYWFETTRTPAYPYAADALALLLKFTENDSEND